MLVAERAGRVLGQRVAVALAVGGAHERRHDLEVPLADLARLAPEVGEPEVDVELEQIDPAGCLCHAKRVDPRTIRYGQPSSDAACDLLGDDTACRSMGAIRLGPARVPSRESPEAAVEILLERGYSACELDFERGFWMDYPWAERLGEVAARARHRALGRTRRSFAFPGHPTRRRPAGARRCSTTRAGIASRCGAELVVIHPASCSAASASERSTTSSQQLGELRERLEQKDRAVPFGVEVMGRVRELGSDRGRGRRSRARLGWVRPGDRLRAHARDDRRRVHRRGARSPRCSRARTACSSRARRSTSTSPTSPTRTATRRSTSPTARERCAPSRCATRSRASSGRRR